MVGGEDTGRLHFGIFIKKISPGSIAHEDGRLQLGEFCIRVIDDLHKALKRRQHRRVVCLIYTVQLKL